MPAPAVSSCGACSRTVARIPTRASASAAVSPPMPAPAMTTLRVAAKAGAPLRSGARRQRQDAVLRTRGMGLERGRKAVKRRAIGTDDLGVIAHIEENMRMIERRQCADAHEFLGADLDNRHSRRVVKMGN